MKKLILAALAATVAVSPVLADPRGHDDRGRHEQRFDRHDRDPGNFQAGRFQDRRWNRGERFDYRQARNYRVIGNPYSYHLRPAPRGYRWVQSGNDAVLIGITSGLVASMLAGAFALPPTPITVPS
jgi:Ni/Co efflux regulator RcnB